MLCVQAISSARYFRLLYRAIPISGGAFSFECLLSLWNMINEIFVFPSPLTTERNFYKETHFFNYVSDNYLQFRSPPSMTGSGEISHVARHWLIGLLVSEVTDCASSVRSMARYLKPFI